VQLELHAEHKIPVCKIISKRDEYENAKRKKAASKEAKKQSFKGSEQGMKTLELNWAIDQNDLGHRLEKLKQFLEEGRRVEVVLAGKKKGRKATKEECEALLDRIETTVEETEGAKEKGPMEGKIGGVAKLTFLGKVVKRAEVSGSEAPASKGTALLNESAG
jgi:translation initiation factor IF-3